MMNEVRVPRLVGVPGGKEYLQVSRQRFFFTSLIRRIHTTIFYKTIFIEIYTIFLNSFTMTIYQGAFVGTLYFPVLNFIICKSISLKSFPACQFRLNFPEQLHFQHFLFGAMSVPGFAFPTRRWITIFDLRRSRKSQTISIHSCSVKSGKGDCAKRSAKAVFFTT